MEKQIKWVSMDTKQQTLIFFAMKHNINKPQKMQQEYLVDAINMKIASAAGVEVPAEVLIKKPQPKAATQTSKSRETKPRQPRTSKPKEDTPAPVNVDGLVVTITGRSMGGKVILANRKMLVTGFKNGALKGHLLHEKSGLPQKSEITMPVECTDYTQVVKSKEEVVETEVAQ